MIKGCELFRLLLFHHVKQIVYSHLHCVGGKRWPPQEGVVVGNYFQQVIRSSCMKYGNAVCHFISVPPFLLLVVRLLFAFVFSYEHVFLDIPK
jgi:hypothetical protein